MMMMMDSRCVSLVWVSVVVAAAALAGVVAGGEISALVEFAKGIHRDPLGFLRDTWNGTAVDDAGCPEPGTWRGVVCSDGHVKALLLDNMHLGGEVSLETLTQLRFLSNLSLSNNSLSGGLDSFPVTSMPSLQHLDLSHNRFRGRIPQGFGELHQLRFLDLHSNHLSGQIGSVLFGLERVEYMDLSSNSLSGALPTIDPIDSALPKTLQHLNLSNNRLSGSFLYKVEINFDKLRVLDVSKNKLSGKIPSFNFVYSLEILRLNNNAFSGPLPAALFMDGPIVLREIDLSHNNLSGKLPIVSSTTLTTINLASNRLFGPLPIKFGNCAVVNLSSNDLSGDLSGMKTWGNYVQILDLSHNSFKGSIPNDTSEFLRLIHLNVSHNSLDGSLPSVLGTYPKLTVIDLSSNRFNGPVLSILFTSATLVYANLSNNLLSGSISLRNYQATRHATSLVPISLTKPSQLEALDLSSNSLHGSIPPEFGFISTLIILNLAKNQFSGTIPVELSNLHSLTKLDLSMNQLKGKLPENLPTSLTTLNVTYNNLSGVVPKNLRHFTDSSFHPGNVGLLFPRISPGRIRGTAGSERHNKGFGSKTRAIIIGICTAGAVFLLVLAWVLYYRRNSKVQQFARHSNIQSREVARDVAKGKGLASVYLNLRKDLNPMRPLNFYEKHLLSPEKRTVSLPKIYSPDHAEKGEPDLKAKSIDSPIEGAFDASPSNTRRKSSPGSNKYLSSPHSEDLSIAVNPITLKVHSPDRLAGDLSFLDSTLTFSAEELSRAPAEVLGRSSYGTSYKATLDNGHILTVKWLREGLAKSKNEFVREAKKFRKIKHPNLISMRGYYWGPREHEKLILSDYVITGNLAKHLYDRSTIKMPPLGWAQRLKIAVDIARGLFFLHCDMALPHGNLKATNVLLDGPELTGKLSDYCLHLLTTPAGTAEQIFNAGALGYRAPELAAAKKPKPSLKADIYAFGVILIEILTGKSAGDIVCENSGAADLTDWVRQLASEGRGMDCLDSTLVSSETQGSPKGIDALLAIALKCIQTAPERPTVTTLFEDLIGLVV